MIPKTAKQPKPKLCKWDKEPCEDERVNYPGKSICSPYCKLHLALSHIYKKRQEVAQDKAELEKVRQEVKKGSPVYRFYHTSAWVNFSHYVLLYYADENLMAQCSTDPSFYCEIFKKDICVGHFIKVFDTNSTNYATAFDFRNVGPQSKNENDRGGNMDAMAVWVEKIHGLGTVEELKQLKRSAFKLDKYTLDEISKKYLALFNEELKRRGIKSPWK